MKLHAYKNYVSDKESFCFDEHGARHGETPNFCIDAETPERANLFAAAPELLEACKEALNEIYGMDLAHDELTRQLEAAIAKAEGK